MKILSVIFAGSLLATSTIALANGEAAARAATATPSASATPESAKPKAANDDLSQYKSANALFGHYEEVRNKPYVPNKSASQSMIGEDRKQLFKSQFQETDRIAAEFEKRYPNDPRCWQIKMERLYVWHIRNRVGATSTAKNAREAAAKMQVILNAPNATHIVKVTTLFFILLDEKIANNESYEAWNQKFKEARVNILNSSETITFGYKWGAF